MTSHVLKCNDAGLITPPAFVVSQLDYECIMGSTAYGINDDQSDLDIYGFCMPPLECINRQDIIFGFDSPPKPINVYQEHHVKHQNGTEYDLNIYNIVRYFWLCADGNPNLIDSLFVPDVCVTFTSKIGLLVREHRKMFLSKKIYHKFRGYAYSELSKATKRTPESKRFKLVMKYGYDVKSAANVIRSLEEVRQILNEGDLDLRRSREVVKSIRRGDWSFDAVHDYFKRTEHLLKEDYQRSELPHKPRFEDIRDLLKMCIRMQYGENCFVAERKNSMTNMIINDIENVLQKYRKGD